MESLLARGAVDVHEPCVVDSRRDELQPGFWHALVVRSDTAGIIKINKRWELSSNASNIPPSLPQHTTSVLPHTTSLLPETAVSQTTSLPPQIPWACAGRDQPHRRH